MKQPKFDRHQEVTVFWNEDIIATRVTRRWFDLDDGESGCYWYQIAARDGLYPECVILAGHNDTPQQTEYQALQTTEAR